MIVFYFTIFFLSYKHTDENNLSCEGPPMEIPGEFTNKLNLIYTYSVTFEVSIESVVKYIIPEKNKIETSR